MKNTKYYTPYEVSLHNTIDDIWVSYLGKVYNLTPLIKAHAGDVLLKPLIEMAGKDISHWFNPKTKDIRTHVDPLTGCVKYFTPSGRFLHVPPPWPCSDWPTDSGRPWWRETRYEEGVLSGKTRRLRIVNTLTSQEQTIEVCTEESLNAILQRYLRYNAHAASYTWKHNGVSLDMDKTLGDNGIPDEDEEFYQLRMDRERHTQAIHLYFSDDLTQF